jgi:ABC-type polysaccharide/polyol phosphate export permease
MSIGNVGSGLNNAVNAATDIAKKTIDVEYRHHRNVALGTGITALIALIAIVAISILFHPFALAFSVCIPLAATALALLAPISLAYGIKAARIQHAAQLLQASQA